jgi:cell wall-associated NlpC family hydrolase
MTALGTLIGTPYVKLGRTPEGVDCWGAVFLIYHTDLNILLPTFLCYDDEGAAEVHALVEQERNSSDWILVKPPYQIYDIFLYRRRRRNGSIVPHVAVFDGIDRIVHCLEDVGICRDRTDRLSTFRLDHNSFVAGYRHRRMLGTNLCRAVKQ